MRYADSVFVLLSVCVIVELAWADLARIYGSVAFEILIIYISWSVRAYRSAQSIGWLKKSVVQGYIQELIWDDWVSWVCISVCFCVCNELTNMSAVISVMLTSGQNNSGLRNLRICLIIIWFNEYWYSHKKQMEINNVIMKLFMIPNWPLKKCRDFFYFFFDIHVSNNAVYIWYFNQRRKCKWSKWYE